LGAGIIEVMNYEHVGFAMRVEVRARTRKEYNRAARAGRRETEPVLDFLYVIQRARPILCVATIRPAGFISTSTRTHAKDKPMTLVIYLVGWLILIGGVSWALVAMHVTQHTILIVDVILLGIAVITGATRARNRDRS
jgi:hypothetical protein